MSYWKYGIEPVRSLPLLKRKPEFSLPRGIYQGRSGLFVTNPELSSLHAELRCGKLSYDDFGKIVFKLVDL